MFHIGGVRKLSLVLFLVVGDSGGITLFLGTFAFGAVREMEKREGEGGGAGPEAGRGEGGGITVT